MNNLVTYVEWRQAVPAEHMFTTLAHHLCTAGVTLDWHVARRTTLYQRILRTIEWNSETTI